MTINRIAARVAASVLRKAGKNYTKAASHARMLNQIIERLDLEGDQLSEAEVKRMENDAREQVMAIRGIMF